MIEANCLIDVGLVVWCMFVYACIHFRRLDASRDVTFLGLGGARCNESSRCHLCFGVVSGYLYSTQYSSVGGIGMLILYSLRNLKHEPRFDVILRRARRRCRPFPPIWRNSMCRQQMQFHAGLGLGSLMGKYIFQTSYYDDGLLSLILAVSLLWGSFHISLSPWNGPRTNCK